MKLIEPDLIVIQSIMTSILSTYMITTSEMAGPTHFFALCITHFVFGSLIFDLVHWLAHKSHASPYYMLRLLAQAHSNHHRFFTRKLEFNETFRVRNLLSHLPLELFCQIAGSIVSWLLIQQLLPSIAHKGKQDIVFVLIVQLSRTCVVVWNGGRDSNHIPFVQLPHDPYVFFVGPQYHSQHHIDPQNYFGSMTRSVDWVFGTAASLEGRRVAMTGSGGALGQALLAELSLQGVKHIKPLRFGLDWTYGNYSNLISVLANTDILILAHGTKSNDHAFQANCYSAVDIIELFKRSRRQSMPGLLPEVWYVGSEAELHGSWSSGMDRYTASKRAFVPFARAYYNEKSMVYRHIVPAAFKSNMGNSLVTANWTAKTTLWWIRRGARYAPVTYTGFAYANFFRFMFLIKPYNTDKITEEKAKLESKK